MTYTATQVLAASSYAALLGEAWDAVSGNSDADARSTKAALALLECVQDLCYYQTVISEPQNPARLHATLLTASFRGGRHAS